MNRIHGWCFNKGQYKREPLAAALGQNFFFLLKKKHLVHSTGRCLFGCDVEVSAFSTSFAHTRLTSDDPSLEHACRSVWHTI